MNINFLKYKKAYFIFSGTLVLVSLVVLFVFGLKPGIDFRGGSILELEYKTERPTNQLIKDSLATLGLEELQVQSTGEKGVILRMQDIPEKTHKAIVEKLQGNGELEELRFESIGPVIGKELKEKTKVVIVLSLLAVVLYIAFAFRRLTFPAKSWQYGLVSLVALSHDVLIPLGILSILVYLYDIQITIPIIVALLTVLGYSINNTVVVFDRIRENLLKGVGEDYQKTVNISLNQTLARSINTSLTTLFVLGAIFFLGGETLRYFALTMILGIVAGTYSSLFLTSPILVTFLKWKGKI